MSEVLVDELIHDEGVSLYGDHVYVMQKCTSVYTKSVNSDKTIHDHLRILGIDDEVIDEAAKVYDELDMSVRRGKKWLMMLYYCIDTAYIRLGDPQDPKDICDLLGMSVTIAAKVPTELLNTDKHYIVYVTPEVFVDLYCCRLRETVAIADSDIDSMIAIAKYIGEDKIDDYPQVIAAAIIQYYCTMKKIQYDKKAVEQMVHKSGPTISKIVNRIKSMIEWDLS